MMEIGKMKIVEKKRILKKIALSFCILVVVLCISIGAYWCKYNCRKFGNTIGNTMNLFGSGVQTKDGFLYFHNDTLYNIQNLDNIVIYDKLPIEDYGDLFYYNGEVYCAVYSPNFITMTICRVDLSKQQLHEITTIGARSDVSIVNGKIYYVEYNQEEHKDKLYSIDLDGSNKKYIGECCYLEFVQFFVKGKMNKLECESWMYVEKAFQSMYQGNKDWWYVYEDVEITSMDSYLEKMINYPRKLYRVNGETGERHLLDENVTVYNLGEEYIYYAKQSQDENISYIYRCDLVGNDKTQVAEIKEDNLMTGTGLFVGDDVLVCVMFDLSETEDESVTYVIDLKSSKMIKLQ